MFVVCVIASVLLAAMLLASAGAKLVKAPPVVENLGAIGVPLAWFPRLSVLENLLLYGARQPGERMLPALLQLASVRRREEALLAPRRSVCSATSPPR